MVRHNKWRTTADLLPSFCRKQACAYARPRPPPQTAHAAVAARLRGGAAGEGERGDAAGGGLGEVALREEAGLAASTNFVFAQFVIRECKPSEFFFVMGRTPATIVMVLCDRLKSELFHTHFISELLQRQGEVLEATRFDQGALVYRRGCVSAVAECGGGLLEDESWMFSSFKVFLGVTYNPLATVITLACVYLKASCWAAPWSRPFLRHMKERIVGDEVFFLC